MAVFCCGIKSAGSKIKQQGKGALDRFGSFCEVVRISDTVGFAHVFHHAAGAPVEQGFHVKRAGFADGIGEAVRRMGFLNVIVDQTVFVDGQQEQSLLEIGLPFGKQRQKGFRIHPSGKAVYGENQKRRIVEIRFSDGSCSDSGGVNSQTVCRHPVWHPSVGTAVTDRIADAVYNILIRNGEACVFHHIGKIAEPQSVIAGSAVRGINHSAVCSCAAAAMDKIGGEST